MTTRATSEEDSSNAGEENRAEDEVYMDRHMGYLRAVGILSNSVIGTGIFLSPTGIASTVGSVGATLLIWVVCGILSILTGLVYCELGTMMPKAGGYYAFILDSFGPMVAFSTMWGSSLISSPAMLVIMGRVSCQYLLGLFFPECTVPYIIQQLMVPTVGLFLAYVNCANIYLAAKLQTFFSICKFLALVTISITGIAYVFMGYTHNFETSRAFEDTKADPSSLAVAVMFGFFSYSGWELLFVVQEEVRNPGRNLPLVCISSLVLITTVYVLTNFAYFTVMTVDEMVASPGVVLTFGVRTLGSASWITSIFVAISTIGLVNTNLFGLSRVIFSMSRQGSLPRVLGMLHGDRNSPIPAVIYLVIVGSLYLPVENIYDIISFSTFISQFSIILTLASWFYFRWKKPDMKRTFKVPFVIPVIVLLCLVAMMVLAFIRSPLVYGLGLAVYLSSFPVYLLNKYFLSRSRHVKKPMDVVTTVVQQLLNVVPEKRNVEYIAKEN